MSGENGTTAVDGGIGDGLRRLEPLAGSGPQAQEARAVVQPSALWPQPVGGSPGTESGPRRDAALPKGASFGIYEHYEPASLDELVKLDALARMKKRGLEIQPHRFFERARVARYDDGSVRVFLEE